MARGRPPKPTALNLLNGDPGNRRRNTVEPASDGLPLPPANLDPVAAAEWADVVPLLADMGVLGRVDSKMLAMYCRACSRVEEAEALLREIGIKGEMKRVSLLTRIIRETEQLKKSILIEFGCSSAARARMRVVKKAHISGSKWSGKLKVV